MRDSRVVTRAPPAPPGCNQASESRPAQSAAVQVSVTIALRAFTERPSRRIVISGTGEGLLAVEGATSVGGVETGGGTVTVGEGVTVGAGVLSTGGAVHAAVT